MIICFCCAFFSQQMLHDDTYSLYNNVSVVSGCHCIDIIYVGNEILCSIEKNFDPMGIDNYYQVVDNNHWSIE